MTQSGKIFYTMRNVGKAKYVVNFHDSVKTHDDGSDFYDIAMFSNKRKFVAFQKKLISEGYKER